MCPCVAVTVCRSVEMKRIVYFPSIVHPSTLKALVYGTFLTLIKFIRTFFHTYTLNKFVTLIHTHAAANLSVYRV